MLICILIDKCHLKVNGHLKGQGHFRSVDVIWRSKVISMVTSNVKVTSDQRWSLQRSRVIFIVMFYLMPHSTSNVRILLSRTVNNETANETAAVSFLKATHRSTINYSWAGACVKTRLARAACFSNRRPPHPLRRSNLLRKTSDLGILTSQAAVSTTLLGARALIPWL